MTFKKLSDSLKDKFFRKDHLSRQLEIVKVFDIYKTEIKKLFPQDRETKPISLKNKILTVETSSSVMANELRFSEREVTDKINQILGREILKRVIYRY